MSVQDPSEDPERRAALERQRQADPRQLKIPFSESARPLPNESERSIRASIRKTLMKKKPVRSRRKHGAK